MKKEIWHWPGLQRKETFEYSKISNTGGSLRSRPPKMPLNIMKNYFLKIAFLFICQIRHHWSLKKGDFLRTCNRILVEKQECLSVEGISSA